MKFMKLFILSLLVTGNFLSGAQAPISEAQQRKEKMEQFVRLVDQLKQAVFDKADSTMVQEVINNIKKSFLEAMGKTPGIREMWNDVIAPQKAKLVGNAESAARVVDLQVQQLIKRNKPVPPALQEQHANARTNIHEVKDFLYSLEKEMDALLQGRRTMGTFANWSKIK